MHLRFIPPFLPSHHRLLISFTLRSFPSVCFDSRFAISNLRLRRILPAAFRLVSWRHSAECGAPVPPFLNPPPNIHWVHSMEWLTAFTCSTSSIVRSLFARSFSPRRFAPHSTPLPEVRSPDSSVLRFSGSSHWNALVTKRWLKFLWPAVDFDLWSILWLVVAR